MVSMYRGVVSMYRGVVWVVWIIVLAVVSCHLHFAAFYFFLLLKSLVCGKELH